MQIFIDSANKEEIEYAAKLNVVSGVTTNPTLLMRNGINLDQAMKEIASIINGPVSLEVSEDTAENMLKQALDVYYKANNRNVVIKVPMTEDGLKLCRELSNRGIKTNVTLIFTLNQAILAINAGATYISPFIGRLCDYENHDDAGFDLIKSIKDYMNLNKYYSTKVIAASIRKPYHVEQAALAGADIVTVPFKILKEMYEHELTTQGLEIFRKDEGR